MLRLLNLECCCCCLFVTVVVCLVPSQVSQSDAIFNVQSGLVLLLRSSCWVVPWCCLLLPTCYPAGWGYCRTGVAALVRSPGIKTFAGVVFGAATTTVVFASQAATAADCCDFSVVGCAKAVLFAHRGV